MLLFPNLKTYNSLLEMAVNGESSDGGDQELLNIYWECKWGRPRYLWNLELLRTYRFYGPALSDFGKRGAGIVHFIGKEKPWDFEGGGW